MIRQYSVEPEQYFHYRLRHSLSDNSLCISEAFFGQTTFCPSEVTPDALILFLQSVIVSSKLSVNVFQIVSQYARLVDGVEFVWQCVQRWRL